MRFVWRVVSTCALGSVLTLAACVDDGADDVQRAAELRASTTVPASTPLPITPTTTVTPTGVVVPVMAIDNTFRPDVVEIKVGDEVLWENRGMNEHDILFVEGEDWGVEVSGFQPGAFYSHVFTEPGEYAYYCAIHGDASFGMTGIVVVTT